MIEINQYNHVLFTSVIDGKLDIVKDCIEKHKAEVNYTPVDANMLLLACANNNWEIANYLVDNGANVFATNDFKLSALHIIAMKNGPIELFEKIIGKAAFINNQTSAGETILMLAIKNKRKDLVDCLLDNPLIRLNTVDKKEMNALHYAALAGEKEIFFNVWIKGGNILALNKDMKTPVDLIEDESWKNELPNIEEKYKIVAPKIELTSEELENLSEKEQEKLTSFEDRTLVLVSGISSIERKVPVQKNKTDTKMKIK